MQNGKRGQVAPRNENELGKNRRGAHGVYNLGGRPGLWEDRALCSIPRVKLS